MAGAVRRPLNEDERKTLTTHTRRYRAAREKYTQEREALHVVIREVLAAEAAPSQILQITGYTSSQLYQIRDTVPSRD